MSEQNLEEETLEEETPEENQSETEAPETSEEENPEESEMPSADPNPEIQRRDAQIKHWREKAEKAESDLIKASKKTQKTVPASDPLEIVSLAVSRHLAYYHGDQANRREEHEQAAGVEQRVRRSCHGVHAGLDGNTG